MYFIEFTLTTTVCDAKKWKGGIANNNFLLVETLCSIANKMLCHLEGWIKESVLP